MGNIEAPKLLLKEVLSERRYKIKEREIKIARTRASVLRKQITEAYQILENIRFDFLGDTAFRGKITGAKQNLERAMCDFLLDDSYWKERIEKHRGMTHQEYSDMLENQGVTTPQSK